MMLTIIVLVCLAVSLMVANAVQRHALRGVMAVPIVAGLPLVGWLYHAGDGGSRALAA